MAIPISLIGSFFIMYVSGFSINILTLLAIVLSTGIVVDDAIVVLENIYSKIEGGMDPMKAGHEGSKEITFAIISTTVTLGGGVPAHHLPQRFDRSTLPRVRCGGGRIGDHQRGGLAHAHAHDERALAETQGQTQPLLRDHRALVQQAVRRIRAITRLLHAQAMARLPGHPGQPRPDRAGLRQTCPASSRPNEDKSRFMVQSTAPEGTSFELMNAYLANIINVVDTMPESSGILISVTAPGFGYSQRTNTASFA
jgi:multidrug efflux pump